VINLEVVGESAAMSRVAELLDEVAEVSRVRVVQAARPGHAVVSAEVRPKAVDSLLETLRGLGVPGDEITLTRMEVVGSLAKEVPEASLVWADLLSTAWLNARPIARYLAFMFAAGVVACYGVIDDNGILIVGAIFAFAQDRLNLIPSGFSLEQTGVLGRLTSVNDETIVVALVAGNAGMLALETRASAGVGVAISVTTIPAAAYFGVAVGLGEIGEAKGALGLLGANLAMMIVGAVGTLALQTVLRRRAAVRRSAPDEPDRPGNSPRDVSTGPSS
jgi:hypothetical protein